MDGYSIEVTTNRVVVRGTLPIDEMSALSKVWKKRGLTAMALGVSSALGATLAVCAESDIDAWTAEVQKRVTAKAGGDVELEWLMGTDTGTSSRSIFSVLASTDRLRGMADAQLGRWGKDVPRDPDDFGRCFRLLKRFPTWRERLNEVAAALPKYGPMVREWAAMEALWNEESPTGKCPKLFKLMQKLEDEGCALIKTR